MRRREFITFLGTSAAWPLAIRSQQHECVAKLGILMQYAERDVDFLGRLASFRGQLRKLGWIENRDLEIEERCSGDDVQRIK
jgi:putative tryptophan/tyrosine transport system substrate-binding protein